MSDYAAQNPQASAGFLKRVARFLLHPMTLAFVGIVAIALVVWYVGPLIAIGERRPLDPVWVRVTVVAVLLGLWVLRLVWRMLRQRRANTALVEGMAKGPTAADKELAVLQQRFAEALQVLKNAPGRKKRGNALYEMPWYMFIGAPGSGKTTALLNAGLTFPLAEKMGAGSVRGVGGTRNCDWWFTDEAVLIDTAGRYTLQESNEAVDASAWDNFLALLRRSRPRRPLNGVLLTVNIQDLLQQTPVERKDHAAKLRARIQELHEKLGVRPPVYVMITKADLVAGFNESFASLNKEERNQVWGFTFPYSPDSIDDPLVNFGSEFAALEKRLRDRIVPLMEAEHEVLKRAAIFNFPQQFAGIRGLLGGFLEQVFSGGGTIEEKPLLRGVYFTSGTQEGTPIDRVLGTLARTFGIERRMPPVAGTRGKSFFLHRLLKDVVFGEQGLVGQNVRMERRRARLRLAGFAVLSLVSIALVAGWFVSYGRNKAYVAEVEARLPEVKQAVAAIPPATTADVTALAPVLTVVRTAAMPKDFTLADPPLSMRFGLYQAPKLNAAAELGYQRLLDHALMPRIVRRLEERLRAANRNDLEVAYEALKNYLMVYTPDKFDASAFHASVSLDWDATLERQVTPEQRQALDADLASLLDHGGTPKPQVPIDQNLVATVRDMLVAFPLEHRVFNRLKRSQIGADIQPFTVAGAAGPGSLSVFRRVSGEPLTKGIPGLFTREGFRKAFESSVDRATRQAAAEESWVLGVRTTGASTLPIGRANQELTNRVRRLYFEEYIKVWDQYIADVKLVPMTSTETTLQVTRQLAGVDSPLAAFMRGIARETKLVVPVPVAGSTAGTQIGKVDSKALQAKKELEAVVGAVRPAGAAGGSAPGQPLEQMVDDHFAHIHRLVEGQPPPIDEMTKLFNEVYVYATAVDAAQKSKSPPPPAAGAERVKAAAGQLPEPARGALETAAAAATSSGRTAEREGLSAELKPISEFCNRTVSGRYPFTPSSRADVLPEDFAQLFGVGGQLDTFFTTKLQPLVDTGGAVWRFKPTPDGSQPVNAAALADFQRAARIKEVFFRSGGKTPSFRVDIRALEMDPELKEVSLDIDGQVFKFVAGNTTPVTVQWPSTRVASQIKLTTVPPTGAPLLFDGPWALFRMFDRFEAQPTQQPERFTVPMLLDGRKVRLEVTASSVFNPFRLREIQQFRCPGSL